MADSQVRVFGSDEQMEWMGELQRSDGIGMPKSLWEEQVITNVLYIHILGARQ